MENKQPGQSNNNSRPPSGHRRAWLWSLGLTVLLLLAIIISQQLWLWTVLPSDSASDTLLLYALSTLNFVAFVVFSFIFIRNLLKLRRERRERQLGSKIKTRLLVYFIALSFLPIIAMAVFSYLFLNRSLEKWFNRLPEDVVKQAREVQREALSAQNRSLRETASLFAVLLSKQSPDEQQTTLNEVVATGEFSGLEIVRADGAVLTRARASLGALDSQTLENLFSQARRSRLEIGETLADGKGFDVIAVPLTADETLIISPPRRAESDLNDAITGSQSEYQKLVKRQRTVRLLGLSTLGLMTLMLLFVSSWVAIYLARGIATPIKALAEASNEIARGNLSHRVITFAEDELALLAHSFNQMTAQLHENRRRIELGAAELREKNLALEDRRNYIETVLESLSTGVVSLDENDRVTTINASAAKMLGIGPGTNGHLNLRELVAPEDGVNFARLLSRARRTGQAAEQTQLVGQQHPSGTGSIPVALTATALRSSPGQGRGVVLVIEDLSELLSAQRTAAWSEVARRMAHEIKNPLTPIQLSAERIARNYRRSMAKSENGQSNGNGSDPTEDPHVAAVIAECTDTINREVAGLKAMVDEFSRFARLPEARLEAADLNEVIRYAVGLYEERLDGVEINLKLSELPPALLDAEQMRRVFVNLIDNALNALTDIEGDRSITISTKHDAERSVIVTEVADNGQGILPADFARLFQPYFSRRDSGTGLGLAIIQRIILEHRSRIRAETNHPRGAKFVIEMPA